MDNAVGGSAGQPAATTDPGRPELGRLGIWSIGLRRLDAPQLRPAVAAAEAAGFGAIWFPAGAGGRGFEIAGALLAATERVTVATGITSIWATTPQQSTDGFAELEAAAPGRFLLGVGVSHGPMVDQNNPGRYRQPLQSTARYLDALPTIPRERRILAALGPKMLELAVAQALGTHPYLVTPPMTGGIRERVGVSPVVAVEQGVVLESDPGAARKLARQHLQGYLALPNYVNNWLRNGYTDQDVTDGGSDRLVDDLVAWGDPAAVAERIGEHYAAGADHVCVQVLGGRDELPVPAWQQLAREVLGR